MIARPSPLVAQVRIMAWVCGAATGIIQPLMGKLTGFMTRREEAERIVGLCPPGVPIKQRARQGISAQSQMGFQVNGICRTAWQEKLFLAEVLFGRDHAQKSEHLKHI